jgi:spore coat protein U-like protein
MRNCFPVCLGLAAASALSVSPAFAQTETAEFNVQITIDAECLIDSATDLDFGSSGVIDSDIDATSTITVTCTSGTDYDIGLSPGTGDGATVATRLMTGPDGDTVQYSLFQDAGRTLVWGDTVGTDTVSATGTGAPQAHDVFGRVFEEQDTPQPGTYEDVITVTVTY